MAALRAWMFVTGGVVATLVACAGGESESSVVATEPGAEQKLPASEGGTSSGTCTTSSECPPGWTCEPQQNLATKVCVAPQQPNPSTPEDAGSDRTTDAGSDATTNDAEAGTDPGPDVLIDAGAPDEVFSESGEYPWTVPANITSVTVRVWGGGGAGGVQLGATGGGAAYVRATLAVTPGEVLQLEVAEGGKISCLGPGRCNNAGNGAGASSMWRDTTLLVMAGGGGGGGSDGNGGKSYNGGRGGAGGGTAGQAGQGVANTGIYCPTAAGGSGGTQSAGGAGGAATKGKGSSPGCTGQPGGTLTGGKSSWTMKSGSTIVCDTGPGAIRRIQGGGDRNGGGGGGGAGYFGGGGAGYIPTHCAGGGGGGSSYAIGSATDVRLMGGNYQVQANAAESVGAGRGGDDAVTSIVGSAGSPGRIELFY